MATVEELLTRLVNLENEAEQARQRQASAEQAMAHNVLRSYPQEPMYPPLESWTGALLGSRSRSWVRRQNGQPGNSRSRHSRVQCIRR